MDLTNAIVVKTFSSNQDADVAASQLRSRGIECVISTDDAGGMYPPLGVIKLLVDPSNADQAREILQATPAPMNAPFNAPREKEDSRPTPPRVYRFNSGLLLGILLGVLLHFGYAYSKQHRSKTAWYDLDRDGVPDEEIVWRNGRMLETRLDRNGDSHLDHWGHYSNGVLLNIDNDNNFDGRPDVWINFSPKLVATSEQLDTDFNGVPDVFMTYSNGIIRQLDWRPNNTNVVLRRQLYRAGVLDEELRDFDGDGQFDLSIKFDPFSNPIQTNNLKSAKLPR
jgi:hypothetical protein